MDVIFLVQVRPPRFRNYCRAEFIPCPGNFPPPDTHPTKGPPHPSVTAKAFQEVAPTQSQSPDPAY